MIFGSMSVAEAKTCREHAAGNFSDQLAEPEINAYKGLLLSLAQILHFRHGSLDSIPALLDHEGGH